MKIAVATEDGITVSQHFGRAPWYLVFNVENGKITETTKKEKFVHHHAGDVHEHSPQAGVHGCDSGSQERHTSMVQSILDCQALIVGGMGWGAYESLKSYNIEPIVTDVNEAEKAVKLYVEGKLENLMQRVH